ncbi:MAG: hypothetical protein M3Y31_00055 [Gemmatimonadota bacterium]|nr:hypothetical protein [Gemmatimonadota bacterium]
MIRRALALGAALLLVAVTAGSAQDTTVVRPDSARPVPFDSVIQPDTLRLLPDTIATDTVVQDRVGPMGAFWRSFLVPGWGQAALGRRTAAGVFIAIEGATLAMTVKTMREVSYLRRTNSSRLDDKEQEREDWLVILGFNHLLSGLEAYVSAQLWDFPGDLQIRRVPGGAAAEVSFPMRIR